MWVSREAAFRSTDDWKDTTMPTEAATCAAVIGLDVGKFSHWACDVTRQGEVLRSEPVANTEHDLDGLSAQAEAGTLVVVDQVRNIGSLAISRARLAGLPVAYLPGIAAHGAAKLFAGDAKTDERDAAVIAKTALGIPDSLLPVPKHGERLEAQGRWRRREATWSPAPPAARTGSGASSWKAARNSRRWPTWRTPIG